METEEAMKENIDESVEEKTHGRLEKMLFIQLFDYYFTMFSQSCPSILSTFTLTYMLMQFICSFYLRSLHLNYAKIRYLFKTRCSCKTDKLALRQMWLEKSLTSVRLQLAQQNSEVSNPEEEVKLADRIFRGMLTERDYYFYTKE